SMDLVDRLLATGGGLLTVVLGADAPDRLPELLERHLGATPPEGGLGGYRGGPPREPGLVGGGGMAGPGTPPDPLGPPARAKNLARRFDLHTVGDLLGHYPRRYYERGELTDLSQLRIGDLVVVMAEVQRAHLRNMKNRRGTVLEVLVGDGRRTLTLTFFNQAWREKDLVPGRRAPFAGEGTGFKGRAPPAHPEYRLLRPAP